MRAILLLPWFPSVVAAPYTWFASSHSCIGVSHASEHEGLRDRLNGDLRAHLSQLPSANVLLHVVLMFEAQIEFAEGLQDVDLPPPSFTGAERAWVVADINFRQRLRGQGVRLCWCGASLSSHDPWGHY